MDWPFTRWCDELRLQVAGSRAQIGQFKLLVCPMYVYNKAVVVSKNIPLPGMNRIPRIRQFP